jgi:hypothetical protein
VCGHPGNPAAPRPEAITHVQFWSRPYQSAQRFKSGSDANLCLKDYIEHIAVTTSKIHAYAPIHAKPFAGVHLVAFTVRPPLQLKPQGGVLGDVHPPQWHLQCSYHFTVNGCCGVEVLTTLADPDAVLVVFALNDAAYPSLPEPSSKVLGLSVTALLKEAKNFMSETAADALALAGWQHSDLAVFRIYNAPATSSQDSVNVVPFTPLNTLPRSNVVTDPSQPFPVRGWLKLAWVGLTSTTGGGDNIALVRTRRSLCRERETGAQDQPVWEHTHCRHVRLRPSVGARIGNRRAEHHRGLLR